MNLEKRENCRYVSGENLARHLKSPKFKRLEVMTDEVFEICKKKSRITDIIPIHLGKKSFCFDFSHIFSVYYFI